MNRGTLLLCCFAVGCGGKASSLVPVSGVLTDQQGHPLANVLVQFHPEDGDGKMSSSGTTNTEGKFTLTCDDGKPGAVIGKHKVTLVDNPAENEPDFDPKMPAKGTPPRFGIDYQAPTSTPLTITVEKGKTEYQLKLQ